MSKGTIDSDMSTCSATKAEQRNIPSESNTSKGTSLAARKREKQSKSARFDFLGVKGVIYLSSDYRVVDGPQIVTEESLIDQEQQHDEDQTPMKIKEVACSEEVGQAGFEPVRPAIANAIDEPGLAKVMSAKPSFIVPAAEPVLAGMKSAGPAIEPGLAGTKAAKRALHTVAANPGLARMDPARPVSSIPAGAEATSGDSALVVDRSLEMKNNIIQIKDTLFSNMINKVTTSILLNFQSGHVFSIATFISDIIASNVKGPIEKSNLLVGNTKISDCIGQHIIPYREADNNILSKSKFPTMVILDSTSMWVALLVLSSIHTWSQMRYKLCNYFGLYDSGPRLKNIAHADVDYMINFKTSGMKDYCKGVAEWIDVKSDPFVCLALKPTPQKNRLKKSKYTFDLSCCDHIFDILLKNNFIRIIDHNALPSIHNLEELKYCKWHNSFDHNTSSCNMFRRIVQSAIDKGRLRFSKVQQMDQLNSIGLDGKQVSNRLALADSIETQGLNAQVRDVEPSSEDKVVVHELLIKDIPVDNKNITISKDTGGQVESLQLERRSIDPIDQRESANGPPLEHVYQDGEKMEDSCKDIGGKGRDKQSNRRPKLSFEELLVKYEKISKANVINRPKKIKSSKLPPKHKSQERNWQGNRSHAAATYFPFEQPIPMSYGSQPIYYHPYSYWGCSNQEAHIPSYSRPQYMEYTAPKYPKKPSSYQDRFDQDRSGAKPKKKAVKQVYRVKYDGRKNKISDLNSTIEKPITLLKNPVIDGKGVGQSSVDILDAKSEQKKVKVPKIKNKLPLSKNEIKPICSFGLQKWQEKKLQRLSAEKLKEKGFAWVPKRRIQAHKNDVQAIGATMAKRKRQVKKQLPHWRFAPNHQNYWAWHHSYSLPMFMWNPSLGMHDYYSDLYFDPWHEFLYHGELPNYYVYQ